MFFKYLATTLAFLSVLSLGQSQSTDFPTESGFPTPSATISAGPVLPSPSSGVAGNNTSVKVTALVGANNATTLQCWQLQPNATFSQSTGAYIQPLGDFTNASLAIFNGANSSFVGLTTTDKPQWTAFLAGGGTIRLHGSGQFATFRRGDLFVANDTTGSQGHESLWLPGTVALQLPVSGAVNYVVINNNGSCNAATRN
ncbi:hypothetical protein CPB83DRAFT_850842 [Crepidotus variabilis]|uniref:Uncharacterized protein n=1 Tax=Crepidotus variabilis TaxID=179855 RepID=A0A9P6EK83_9AGAR|nr:hypothetical protein CPB83DRAFT_850842 [Crepidotus variabilis]